MSALVGGAEWNVGRTEWIVHGAEWNVHARCQHPSETKSLTLNSQFSSYYFKSYAFIIHSCLVLSWSCTSDLEVG